MKGIFIRIGFLLLLALLQVSFLNLLPHGVGLFPFVLFSYAVSRVQLSGFHTAIPSVVALGVLSDILTSEPIGTGVFFAVGVAYTVSFFSKRFTLEHQFLTLVASGMLVGTVAFLSTPVFSALLSVFGDGSLLESFANLSLSHGAGALGIGLLLFPGIHLVTKWFDDRMRYMEINEKW